MADKSTAPDTSVHRHRSHTPRFCCPAQGGGGGHLPVSHPLPRTNHELNCKKWTTTAAHQQIRAPQAPDTHPHNRQPTNMALPGAAPPPPGATRGWAAGKPLRNNAPQFNHP